MGQFGLGEKNEALNGGVRTKPKTKTKTASFIIKKTQDNNFDTNTKTKTEDAKVHVCGVTQIPYAYEIHQILCIHWVHCTQQKCVHLKCNV